MGLAFVLFLAAGFLAGCGRDQEKQAQLMVRPVKSMVLETVEAGLRRTFPGEVQAAQRSILSFRVSGQLLEFPVSEGQSVARDEILARLDPRDYEQDLAKIDASLAEARASLKAMKRGARPEDLKILEADLKSARARFEKADKDFQRFKKLRESGSISQSRFEQAEKSRDVAQADLRTAQEKLNKGKKGARGEDIEAMEANLRSLEATRARARNALADTTLRAPFPGLITQKFIKNFQQVKADQDIVALQDISTIEIVINLPEQLVAQAKGPETVKFEAEFPYLPGRRFSIEPKEFSAEADPQTRTYRVVLAMPPPSEVNILPGMTASIFISTLESGETKPTGRFMVPVNAVFADRDGKDKQYVWVVDQAAMTVSLRPVSLGPLTGQQIIITGGLEAGERIVIAGVHHLQEGMKVSLLQGKIGS